MGTRFVSLQALPNLPALAHELEEVLCNLMNEKIETRQWYSIEG
jgi:hypothetical protein